MRPLPKAWLTLIALCTLAFAQQESALRASLSATKAEKIYTARELRGKDGDALNTVIDEVRARMRKAGNPPLYLTFDIDALDPAFAPGTGTPEVAAQPCTSHDAIGAWHYLNWVGMDLCGVSPPYDHAELTSNAAATLVWTWICGKMANHEGN